MAGQSSGGVTYRETDSGYFAKRALRRHAGVWSLWALGVAAVISGEFSGWNLGLDAGGFGGLLVATVIITVMYFGLCFSIAEMSPALPHTGGTYSFARSAMGPWGGFITGVAESIEYIVTPAVVVTLTRGKHGHTEREGYGQTAVTDVVGRQRGASEADTVH
jgi:ethanolamine permease